VRRALLGVIEIYPGGLHPCRRHPFPVPAPSRSNVILVAAARPHGSSAPGANGAARPDA
jgi:hypothetical protein